MRHLEDFPFSLNKFTKSLYMVRVCEQIERCVCVFELLITLCSPIFRLQWWLSFTRQKSCVTMNVLVEENSTIYRILSTLYAWNKRLNDAHLIFGRIVNAKGIGNNVRRQQEKSYMQTHTKHTRLRYYQSRTSTVTHILKAWSRKVTF